MLGAPVSGADRRPACGMVGVRVVGMDPGQVRVELREHRIAVRNLRDRPGQSKVIILLTDGADNASTIPPLQATKLAQQYGIRIYTIGVGTRGIAKVPGRDAFGNVRYFQQKVDIDEDTLREMAKRTGGKYYRADNTEAMKKIYEEIDKFERTEADVKKFQRYQELFKWFVLAGLSFFGLEMVLGNTVWRRLP